MYSTTKISWESILSDPAVVGGELEVQKGDGRWRGSIAAIERKNELVEFELEWVAVFDQDIQKWIFTGGLTKVRVHPIRVTAAKPDGGDQIVMVGPGFVCARIYPKGGESLDRGEIIGFDPHCTETMIMIAPIRLAV